MADILVRSMATLDDSYRQDVARVFVDGYIDALRSLSRDRERWESALAPAFVADRFWVALIDDEVLGIAACCGPGTRAMHLDREAFRTHLGRVRGSLAHRVMRGNFHRGVPLPEHAGYVECVATAARARGRGIATALMEHIQTLPYDRLLLEVADTNTGAIRLYERLGYHEVRRSKARLPWITGHRYALYLARPASG